MKFIPALRIALMTFLGIWVAWGILGLFAVSLVIILPILFVAGAAWAFYVWYKLHNLGSMTIEGESHEVEIVQTKDGKTTVHTHKIINGSNKTED